MEDTNLIVPEGQQGVLFLFAARTDIIRVRVLVATTETVRRTFAVCSYRYNPASYEQFEDSDNSTRIPLPSWASTVHTLALLLQCTCFTYHQPTKRWPMLQPIVVCCLRISSQLPKPINIGKRRVVLSFLLIE